MKARGLVLGRRPRGDLFYFHTWYRGHNNARYSELLDRLERVDSYLLTFPPGRLPGAVAERAWRGLRSAVEPRLLRRAETRYPYAFVTDLQQLETLSVPAVVDVDDPWFAREEAELLGRPSVAAYVVTDDAAARKLESLGVDRPWHVVPQGVALDSLDAARTQAIGQRYRRRVTTVVGYVAAFLLVPGDRGGDNPLYDVTHLLELWDEISARLPDAKLWLVGQPSARVRRRLEGRSDVVLFGRVPQAELLSYVANFDIALYPRLTGAGTRASKVAEYLGAGVPIVSYDYEVVADVRDAGAGILVPSPREFASAVERLARDRDARGRLADAALAAGAERDWRKLALRYARILDEHLPRHAVH